MAEKDIVLTRETQLTNIHGINSKRGKKIEPAKQETQKTPLMAFNAALA